GRPEHEHADRCHQHRQHEASPSAHASPLLPVDRRRPAPATGGVLSKRGVEARPSARHGGIHDVNVRRCHGGSTVGCTWTPPLSSGCCVEWYTMLTVVDGVYTHVPPGGMGPESMPW